MDQRDRRLYLINALFDEGFSERIAIPDSENDQRRLLRSLFNIRPPMKGSEEFLKVQDEYLKERAKEKGIVDFDSFESYKNDLYLYKGDITTIKADAIVNAANSALLGCFHPCHGCIDNAIHTFSGIQLRYECYEIMKAQGREEDTGKAKITKGYNLPSSHVIHTVGPIVKDRVTENDKKLLKECYLSCLKIARDNNLSSIAFCSISTGVFHFPNEEAAEIAIETVKAYKEETKSKIKVIFNVFIDKDYEIYKRLLKNE